VSWAIRWLPYPDRAGGYTLGAGTGLCRTAAGDDAACCGRAGLHTAASAPWPASRRRAAAAAAIEQVMPTRLRRRVQALQATMVALTANDALVESSVLALLALACRDGERLRFGLPSTGPVWTVAARRALPSGEHRPSLVSGRHDLDRDDCAPSASTACRRPQPTGRHSTPTDHRRVRDSSATPSPAPVPWRARVLMDAPAAVVADLIPPRSPVGRKPSTTTVPAHVRRRPVSTTSHCTWPP